MSDRFESFEVDGTPRVSIRIPAGTARIVGGEPGRVEVGLRGRDSAVERFVIEQRGGEIVIEPEASARVGRWSGVDVEVRIGAPGDLKARVAAGDVTVTVPLASMAVDAGSGDIAAGDVHGGVKIKTGSGDVSLGVVRGRLDVVAASGDIRVQSALGEVQIKTAAGDVSLGVAAAGVSIHSAAGDVDVARFTGDSFNAKTLAGDVALGVTAGREFSVSLQSLSGDVRTDFPVSAGKEIRSTASLNVQTMSGDIVVRSAD